MELHKSKYSDGKTDGRNSRRENKPYRSFRNSGVHQEGNLGIMLDLVSHEVINF
ncbi:hypothetical protein [Candidatus Nitrosopumilus sediminis]|uniref:hypothetical protein n=1 Tax=Candidatus Nitrosopumilus sediminis TaxID=1229909 RepID=UPI000A6309C7|nr:hypothetical protein [Candidatus Nitrosopumilus sediminis]